MSWSNNVGIFNLSLYLFCFWHCCNKIYTFVWKQFFNFVPKVENSVLRTTSSTLFFLAHSFNYIEIRAAGIPVYYVYFIICKLFFVDIAVYRDGRFAGRLCYYHADAVCIAARKLLIKLSYIFAYWVHHP